MSRIDNKHIPAISWCWTLGTRFNLVHTDWLSRQVVKLGQWQVWVIPWWFDSRPPGSLFRKYIGLWSKWQRRRSLKPESSGSNPDKPANSFFTEVGELSRMFWNTWDRGNWCFGHGLKNTSESTVGNKSGKLISIRVYLILSSVYQMQKG